MLKGCYREEKARRLSSNQAFSPNSVLWCIDMPWRRAGCSKWRIITDLRCPLGSTLSATPSWRSTVRETDPITDVSYRVYRLWHEYTSMQMMCCVHVQNFDVCLHDCKIEVGKGNIVDRVELFRFLPLPAEWRSKDRVMRKSFCSSVNSPFFSTDSFSKDSHKEPVWKDYKKWQSVPFTFLLEKYPRCLENTCTLLWISFSRMKWAGRRKWNV